MKFLFDNKLSPITSVTGFLQIDGLNGDGYLQCHARETRTFANGDASAMRDARGRLIGREVYARPSGSNTRILREDLGRYEDGKLSSYQTQRTTGAGGSWATLNETRNYNYDPQNRRLDTETFQPTPDSPVAMETLKYTFDADDLGVRIKAENQTASEVFWEADPGNNGLDDFKRLKTEERESDFYSFIAEGSSVGPGNFTLWLGEGASPTQWSLVDTLYPDPDYGNGQWQAAISLPDGQYTLKAKADHVHPESTFEPEHTSTFTVNAGGEQRTLTNTYDQSGRLTSRSWASGSVTQTFTWDATGKLVKVVQDDARATPLLPDFTWTAVYDPAGRRIKTSYMPGNSPVVGASAARSIHSWYDPMVEFLEIAVESQGKRWWKFHGPDLDSGYGTFQGVGGLEAVIDEKTEAVYPIVDDAFGHVLGYIDLGSLSSNSDDHLIWNEIQMSGYGPLPGYQMKPLEESGDLLTSLVWQTRRIDPTGFFCMGTRYYDSASGSFISTDPLGHAASLDLYSYAGGDPINLLDPDGRNVVSDFGAAFYAEYIGIGERVNATMAQVGFTLTDMGFMATDLYSTGNIDVSRPVFSNTFQVGDNGGMVTSTFGGFGVGPEFHANTVLATTEMTASVGTLGVYNAGAGTVNMFQGDFSGAQDNFVTSVLIGSGSVPSTRVTPGRLPQDLSVNPIPPSALPLNRPVGRTPAQNTLAQSDAAAAAARGAGDVRINQQQVNTSGNRVGTGRPDLQATESPASRGTHRSYTEYEQPGAPRGQGHADRLLSNDPRGVVRVVEVDPVSGRVIRTNTYTTASGMPVDPIWGSNPNGKN